VVLLSEEDIEESRRAARNVQLRFHGKGDAYDGQQGLPDTAFDEKYFRSRLAEWAVARYLGLTPRPCTQWTDKPDILPDIEVRYRNSNRYDLPVGDRDNELYRFVLVFPDDPPRRFRLMGWAFGHEAREFPRFRGDGDHIMPPYQLRSMQSLLESFY
jgi:hypothetical protein